MQQTGCMMEKRMAQDRPPEQAFAALADPTRRQIVEFLAESGPARISEVAGRFPATRQTITRHLDILSQAGITRTERRGRERLTELRCDAFAPVQRWLARYGRFWGDALQDLKQAVEQGERK